MPRAPRCGAASALRVLTLLAVLVVAGCGFVPNSRGTRLYPLQWQPATNLPAHVSSLVFASSSRNVGYACAVAAGPAGSAPSPTPSGKPTPTSRPSPTSSALYRSVVYRSTDGGTTWTALETPFPAGRACRVFVASLDASDVFVAEPASAADESGLLPMLWRSRDAGTTWQALGQITQPGERFSFDAVAVVGQRLVAQVTSIGVPALPAQLYASADDGKTWTQLRTQQQLVGLYAAGETLYASEKDSVPASASAPGPLYRSTDGGLTWAPVKPPYADVANLAFTLAADTTHIDAVGLIPASTAYGTNAHAVVTSVDGGATWARIDAPPTLGTLDVVLLPDATLLLQSRLQQTQPAGGLTAEVFRLRRGETSWELIGLGPYTSGWQVTRTSSASDAATRLWGVAPGPSGPAPYVWAELP